MPSRNSIKIYVRNSYYHIYNRGVEKRIIFEDTQDYKIFLKYLKEYLSPPSNPKSLAKPFTLKGTSFKGVPRLPNNYRKEIELLAFCLLPNHFHFLIKQKKKYSIKRFIHSLLTRYSTYFNKRYERVGSLFQGRYKAVLINEDNYLLHLSRYIHLNSLEYTSNLENAYSSYADYLGSRYSSWIKSEFILSYFNQTKLDLLSKANSYKDFVENYKKSSEDVLGKLIIE